MAFVVPIIIDQRSRQLNKISKQILRDTLNPFDIPEAMYLQSYLREKLIYLSYRPILLFIRC